jgi:hypothetical protein
MSRRRLSVALTLGAALLAATACSSGTDAPQAAQGASAMPAEGAIVDTIKSAATKATAVHIKGSFTEGGSAESMDLQLNKDGSASGTVSEAGASIPVIAVDKVYYVRFTKALMTTSKIETTSEVGKALLDKWVPSTAQIVKGSSLVAGLEQAANFNTMVPNLFNQFGGDTPSEAGTDTVNGVPVHVYTYPDNSSADIATAAPHYLIRIAEPDGQSKGQLDFTGWNKPTKVAAPPKSEIYSGPGA